MKAFWAARGASFCLALTLLLAVAACGGGGDGGGGENETLLTVSSSAPVNGAVNVLRTHSLVLSFSAPLNAATVTTNVVSLQNGAGAAQNITVAASGSQLTITPTQRLFPGTRYTLNVTTALRGTGDQTLSAPVSINFTTDGSWRGALPIASSDLGEQDAPQIAADAAGNVLAVWMQHDGKHPTGYSIVRRSSRG